MSLGSDLGRGEPDFWNFETKSTEYIVTVMQQSKKIKSMTDLGFQIFKICENNKMNYFD